MDIDFRLAGSDPNIVRPPPRSLDARLRRLLPTPPLLPVASVQAQPGLSALPRISALRNRGLSPSTARRRASGLSPPHPGNNPPIHMMMSGGSCSSQVVEVALPVGVPLRFQVSSLQLSAVARVKLAPLVGALPCVGAVTVRPTTAGSHSAQPLRSCISRPHDNHPPRAQVSLMGYPFFDLALEALTGNLMAVPGLTDLVSGALRKALGGVVWPQRIVIPLMPDPATGYARLLPWPEGVLLVRLRGARRLPIVDLGGTIDPFFRVRIDGHTLVRRPGAAVEGRCGPAHVVWLCDEVAVLREQQPAGAPPFSLFFTHSLARLLPCPFPPRLSSPAAGAREHSAPGNPHPYLRRDPRPARPGPPDGQTPRGAVGLEPAGVREGGRGRGVPGGGAREVGGGGAAGAVARVAAAEARGAGVQRRRHGRANNPAAQHCLAALSPPPHDACLGSCLLCWPAAAASWV